MTLGRLPQAVHDDLRVLVGLAALVEDRSPGEQRALVRVAQRLDREYNAQLSSNPYLPAARRLEDRGPCTFSDGHGKACACRGDGLAVEPVGGWSRLAEMVDWEEEMDG